MKGAGKSAGHGKLLEAWVPPEGAGDSIGCLATSFTFDSVFFEEECLGRFLRLETDPTEDGPLYLLEREEKLAQLSCAVALVDRNHCRGSRSLRWDLMPTHVTKGVFHAKVSILHWANCIRIIVASANLTENGYRRNQEIFASLDFRPDSEAPIECLNQITSFLHDILAGGITGGDDKAKARASTFLERMGPLVEGWNIRDTRDVKVFPVLVGQDRSSAIAQLTKLWPGNVLPTEAKVVSPFFDQQDANEDVPTTSVWGELLRKRGRAGIRYFLQVDDVAGSDERLVRAPKTLVESMPTGRQQVFTKFERILIDQDRLLHAKAIWLEDDRWVLYLIGSSNFTSAGLGLGVTNIEANLAFLLDKTRQKKQVHNMALAFPEGEVLNIDETIQWLPNPPEGEDEPSSEDVTLPLGFRSAVYRHSEAGAEVILEIANPPDGWILYREEDDKQPWYGKSAWDVAGRPTKAVVAWPAERPPSGFWVTWRDAPGKAWFPVTVDAPNSLPPPEELRNLPLDVLVDVLTSSRPLHRIESLRRLLKKRGEGDPDNDGTDALIDPHKRVDTSRFLLQRTRRVSWALGALRERLERPVMSAESLWWRLRGPVGVTALAQALEKESQSPEETAFMITELILELHRVRLQANSGYVEPDTIRESLGALSADLKKLIPKGQRVKGMAFGDYIDRVLEVTNT